MKTSEVSGAPGTRSLLGEFVLGTTVFVVLAIVALAAIHFARKAHAAANDSELGAYHDRQSSRS